MSPAFASKYAEPKNVQAASVPTLPLIIASPLIGCVKVTYAHTVLVVFVLSLRQ